MSGGYLSLQSVSKWYGLVKAVENVSIEIEKGEFVAFLGPSGSGKTTTLTMLAGFETPSSGEILLEGRDLTGQRPWQRNIGMVFQSYALFPHLTVEQNIAFPLRMRHVAKKDLQKRVSEVLELVGLSGLAGRYPRELSGGQQQRVAVARGLVFRPEVLLLDEPLGALDKNLREQMQIELKRIHREVGITMIYVTHDQSEAMTMSDRIAVFNRGRLEQVEAPLEIYHRPATKFVGAFVGDSNFYDGSFDAERCELTINGLGMVRALPGRDMAFGTSGKKHIMIRPERLRVVDRVDSDDSTFDIVIRESINYGDSVLLIGSAGDLSVRVRTHASAHIGQGDTIKVAMRSADIHVIARD